MTGILIVEDDVSFATMLKGFLEKNGFRCDHAPNALTALKNLNKNKYEIVISDLKMPDYDGLDLLRDIKKNAYNCPVIIMTSYAHIKSAVKAIKMGAFEYIAKPINPDELLSVIKNALIRSKEKPSTNAAAPSKKVKTGFEFVSGKSEEFQKIMKHLDLVAATEMSVVILGESGTGKEYIARRIHEQSKRKDKPFVSIDCGALTEDLAASELFGHVKGAFTGAVNDKDGQFKIANGGTLFLDEIGNLSYEIQVKLLRVLQERKVRKLGGTSDSDVDVRLITATNEDLKTAASENKFREDLYHRINEFMINLPPLRERKKDIMVYAEYFLNKANEELDRNIEGFTEDAKERFLSYSWPGNLRELKNVIRRSVLLETTDMLSTENLPDVMFESEAIPESQPNQDLKSIASENEKRLIEKTLKEVKYNKSKAARILKIDRSTLYNKIRKYSLE
ncbi:sigma-54 dependent transcriptional regulator [Fulvivirga maritima]|uniref:sigma-54-dependent transcriptional regulator n=1 Tax=Fulvivirga maritima TaxID=2904247 RepID=UPI001F1B024F|nr:sigma-54 dependent transcriptional regulator [Fulvivirga maritima]UII27896.1 sigma-54 dependent transcriptional regulator [Fulvivirga maritima]